MTKLSDTQMTILRAAAERDDRNVLPLPGSLRGGAAGKVLGALLARGLVAETVTEQRTPADATLNRVWRNDEDGRAVLLHLTDAGLYAAQGAATGATQAQGAGAASPGADAAERPSTGAPEAGDAAGAGGDATGADLAPPARVPRSGTKQATLIAMLRSEGGATIAEFAVATGWQSHTVRGAMAGALKKRLDLAVTSEKVEGRGRVYRLPPA